jgi:hypothetical protein
MNRKVSYEDISLSLEQRPDMIYTIDNDVLDMEVVIKKYLSDLKDYINNENLTENEVKFRYDIVDIFEN